MLTNEQGAGSDELISQLTNAALRPRCSALRTCFSSAAKRRCCFPDFCELTKKKRHQSQRVYMYVSPDSQVAPIEESCITGPAGSPRRPLFLLLKMTGSNMPFQSLHTSPFALPLARRQVEPNLRSSLSHAICILCLRSSS